MQSVQKSQKHDFWLKNSHFQTPINHQYDHISHWTHSKNDFWHSTQPLLTQKVHIRSLDTFIKNDTEWPNVPPMDSLMLIYCCQDNFFNFQDKFQNWKDKIPYFQAFIQTCLPQNFLFIWNSSSTVSILFYISFVLSRIYM